MLARHALPQVRAAVATLPEVPEEIIDQLRGDVDDFVSMVADERSGAVVVPVATTDESDLFVGGGDDPCSSLEDPR